MDIFCGSSVCFLHGLNYSIHIEKYLKFSIKPQFQFSSFMENAKFSTKICPSKTILYGTEARTKLRKPEIICYGRLFAVFPHSPDKTHSTFSRTNKDFPIIYFIVVNLWTSKGFCSWMIMMIFRERAWSYKKKYWIYVNLTLLKLQPISPVIMLWPINMNVFIIT